jgi:hypothetical protein
MVQSMPTIAVIDDDRHGLFGALYTDPGKVPDFSMSSQSGHILLPNRKASPGVVMFSFNESPNDKTAGHVYAGLARLFRLLRNARGAGRSRSLGPIEIEGSSLAPTENSTMPPNNTHVKHCDFRRIALSMPETEELNGMARQCGKL